MKLIERLKKADKTDNELFTSLLNEALQFLQMDARGMADQLLVGVTTIKRWVNGKSHPHPIMRPVIYEWLVDVIETKLRDAN
jgi:hypothetical protein